MFYNLAIAPQNFSPKFCLALNESEINKLVDAFHEGREFVTLAGEKVNIKNPDLIKIYDISKRIDASKNSPTYIIKEIEKYANIMTRGIVELNTLREFGEDLTSNFIDGEWGDNKVRIEKNNFFTQGSFQKVTSLIPNITEVKRYWAGGFGRGEQFYDRLNDFKTKNYWQALDYDEDSNPVAAENAWNIFKQIQIGDWFLIKGYGGNHNLTVHYIGQVYSINKKEGKLYFNKINRLLYKGEAPRGEGAGNWRNTLLEVIRPEDINMLFFTEELKDSEIVENKEYDNFTKGTLAHHYTNPNNHKVFDQLNVTNDIKAFASLLAYKNATPPIAIGLFGNWGSGKSYFMTNIRKEIEDLSTTKNLDYCDRIVHVEFNSWFYRDADLWSSLVAKIFTDLHSFLSPSDDPQSVDAFYQNLSSVKEDLAILNDELNKVQLSKALLEAELQKITLEKNEKAEKLTSTPINKIIDAITNEPFIKREIDKINQDLDIKLGSSLSDINNNISLLAGFYNKIKATIKMVTSKNIYFSIFVLVIVTLTIFIPAIYSSLEKQIGIITTWIVRSSILFTSIIAYLRPVFNRINKGYERLKDLSKTWEELVEIEKQKTTEGETKLQVEIQTIEKEIEVFQSKINVSEDKIRLINKSINDIKSGKKLKDFVTARSSDDRYKSKLGVISWVREDFEELDKLIRRNKDANEKGNIVSTMRNEVKIDRIILYIDDLDRCPEDRVVEVLEAVHLLLSFELFGVVVGVDPRWVSHALNKKYSALVLPNGENPNTKNKKTFNASTYDYLEKIFQIPFTLLPIEEQGAKNLIKSYIKIDNTTENDTDKTNVNSSQNEKDKSYILNDTDKIIQGLTSRNANETVSIDSKKLHITQDELNYILNFASLIGSTPRTIQRFVNTYRIIRAHPKVELTQQLSLQHKCIISYLALVVGKPFIAEKIIKKLNQLSNDNLSFSEFTKEFDDVPELQSLLASASYKDLADTKVVTFKTWAPLISRFSFHVID